MCSIFVIDKVILDFGAHHFPRFNFSLLHNQRRSPPLPYTRTHNLFPIHTSPAGSGSHHFGNFPLSIPKFVSSTR